MSSSRTAALTPVLAALLGLCAAASPTGAIAGRGTALCPGSSLLAAAQFQLRTEGAGILSSALVPGDSVETLGTKLTDSPQLAGELVVDEIQPFSFMTPGGIVSGVLQQRVVNADDGTCDCYWRVQLTPGSAPTVRVNRLRIKQFSHPQPNLVADFRNDILPDGIGSTEAARSAGAGTTITFKFQPGIGAGDVSQSVFLDTQIIRVRSIGQVQLRTDNGAVSPNFVAYVPN
jgi:hypothetical protein